MSKSKDLAAKAATLVKRKAYLRTLWAEGKKDRAYSYSKTYGLDLPAALAEGDAPTAMALAPQPPPAPAPAAPKPFVPVIKAIDFSVPFSEERNTPNTAPSDPAASQSPLDSPIGLQEAGATVAVTIAEEDISSKVPKVIVPVEDPLSLAVRREAERKAKESEEALKALAAKPIPTELVNGWPKETEAIIWSKVPNPRLIAIKLPCGRVCSMFLTQLAFRLNDKIRVRLVKSAGDPIFEFIARSAR